MRRHDDLVNATLNLQVDRKCGLRFKVKEETGLDLRNCTKKEVLGHVIHGISHYITVYMAGDVDEVQIYIWHFTYHTSRSFVAFEIDNM